VALEFQIELEFRNELIFEEGGKPEKNPQSRDENQQQTQPTYDAGPGIEPGTHWWEASDLAIPASLYKLEANPIFVCCMLDIDSKFKISFSICIHRKSAHGVSCTF